MHPSTLPVLVSALLLVGCSRTQAPAPDASAEGSPTPPASPTIVLDGETVAVTWDDGDTFSMPNPEGGKRIRARMDGYNTLESYGPVHRWGEWTAAELYGLAKDSGVRAASEPWTCATQEGTGGYGRIRVSCPGLRTALLSEGLATVFAMDAPPDSDALEAQNQAIQSGAGMWAKGVPDGVITSLHSLDEKPDQTETYNRIVDLKTGLASKHMHSETYTTCQEVCDQGSCMVYVPYSARYGDAQAECLRSP